MVDFELSFATLTTEEKKIYLAPLNETELDNLMEYKFDASLRWSDYKKELGLQIESKKSELNDALSWNDTRAVERINAEISDLKLKKARAQRLCEINHLESCCCFIEYLERNGISDEQVDSNNKQAFPLRSWEAVELHLKNNNNYQDTPSEPVLGGQSSRITF